MNVIADILAKLSFSPKQLTKACKKRHITDVLPPIARRIHSVFALSQPPALLTASALEVAVSPRSTDQPTG